LNKIFSLKSNAIFLATLLFLGTIATILPSAQAQPYYEDNRYDSYQPEPKYSNNNSYESQYEMESYEKPSYGKDNYEPGEYQPPQYQEREYNNYPPKYEMDNSYEKKSDRNNYYEEPREYPSYKEEYPKYVKDNYKSKKDISNSVNINKLNCVNNNVNINGNNTGDINVGNSGSSATSSGTDEGYIGVGSVGGSGYHGEGYGKQGKGFDCIINNNNNNIAGGGNQTTPPKATLNVTKNVTCQENTNGLTGISIQQALGPCDLLENLVTENQYLFEVTNDNPVPSQFPGSESGTIVTLGPGNYIVTETPDTTSINQDITTLLMQFPGVDSVGIDPPVFTGDCTEVFPGNRATGTIEAGESQTCNIVNNFRVNLD
jgi:hypothetical protein